MPRRKAAVKREVLPDPLFGSEQVTKFINVIMRKGKKSIAEKIVYSAIQTLAEKVGKERHVEAPSSDESEGGESGSTSSSVAAGKKSSAKSAKAAPVVAKSKAPSKAKANLSTEESLNVLQKSLSNIVPTVEVKSRRVGGATYQVPVDVAVDRGMALAMRWVSQAAKGRGEKTMALRLSAELYEAYMGRGTAVKMRDDVHRMAKANQAFAHYRW